MKCQAIFRKKGRKKKYCSLSAEFRLYKDSVKDLMHLARWVKTSADDFLEHFSLFFFWENI